MTEFLIDRTGEEHLKAYLEWPFFQSANFVQAPKKFRSNTELSLLVPLNKVKTILFDIFIHRLASRSSSSGRKSAREAYKFREIILLL